MIGISKQMERVAAQMQLGFTFKGSPLSLEEVFADTGLLPGLAKRADQVAQLTMGYGLGVTFEDQEEDTLLGVRVKFDEYTPDSLRLLCLTNSLSDLADSNGDKHAVSMDELLYD